MLWIRRQMLGRSTLHSISATIAITVRLRGESRKVAFTIAKVDATFDRLWHGPRNSSRFGLKWRDDF